MENGAIGGDFDEEEDVSDGNDSDEESSEDAGDSAPTADAASGKAATEGNLSKRDYHNQLERKRRASIKDSFNALREIIPKLHSSKLSRAMILQSSIDYIVRLEYENSGHARCLENLKRQIERLDDELRILETFIDNAEKSAKRHKPNDDEHDYSDSPQDNDPLIKSRDLTVHIRNDSPASESSSSNVS